MEGSHCKKIQTSTPYHPSLVSGQVTNATTANILNAVANAEKSVDVAETSLNNLKQSKI